MKSLLERLERLQQRYAALSRREKLLLALGLVLGPLLIGNALFVEPQWKRARNQEKEFAASQGSLAELQTQAGSLQQQLGSDPDAAKKAELRTLTAGAAQLDAQLHEFGSTLVPPEQMNALLQGLLARQAGLRLISLKTLAPLSVLGDKEKQKDQPKEPQGKQAERVFDLYRHGVEIRLEGGYDDLQAYLVQLEKLPQRLLWGELAYRVIEYPRAEMRLTVYTLSSDRTWLAL